MITFEGQKSANRWYPFYLGTGSPPVPVTGILPTQATVQYATAGATAFNAFTLATTTWRELGNGFYSVLIGTSEFAAEGGYALQVIGSGADTVPAYVEVRDRLLSAIDDDLISIGANVLTVLGQTGTSGVKLAPTAIGTAQFQAGAIASLAIAGAAYTHIADQVLAAVATSQQGAGSVGEALVTVRQRVAGYLVMNTTANTIKIYEADNATLRLTLTKAQATGSATITITPS